MHSAINTPENSYPASTPKTCVVIAGPTAVGKTNFAIELARHFNTSIVSADSRQCYRELCIGVAKPSVAQLEQVKHYFVNSHSITEEVNAGIFEQYALAAVHDIFKISNVAIMAGGTGLYIRAFCDGMDAVPSVRPSVRELIASDYRKNGIAWLQEAIKEKDPGWYAAGEIQNPQRMMRALEVVTDTGISILDFHTATTIPRNFNIIKIGLTLPRTQLYQQVNARVDQMLLEGLEAEVRSLVGFRTLNALQTVGYAEWFDFLDGNGTRAQAIERIKINTRHYAKRQLTWFAKDTAMKWFSPSDYNQVVGSLANLV